MTKSHLSLLLLLFFITGKSQFIGQYNMRDGGVDTPNSQLLILPDHEFMIYYFAGFKKGTWKELDKNTIELKETPLFATPVLMYGKSEKPDADFITLDVYSLYKAHASIRFSKDQSFTDELKPIFNKWPNCMEEEYRIKKKIGEYNFVNISIPNNPEFGKFGIQYPYKILNYVFPLDKKYNYFTLLSSNDANGHLFNITIIKKGNKYVIEDYGENTELERKDLDEKTIAEVKEVKNYIQYIEQEENWGDAIPGLQKENEIVYQLNPNPIFKAFCKDDEIENSGPDYYNQPRILEPITRENGIYTVSNYNENNIKIEEFVVAKKSSLNQNDFLSAVKQVSDYDGYEIKISFTEEGTVKFSELLKQNARTPVAFVIDNKVVDFYINFINDPKESVRIGHGISDKQMNELVKIINEK